MKLHLKDINQGSTCWKNTNSTTHITKGSANGLYLSEICRIVDCFLVSMSYSPVVLFSIFSSFAIRAYETRRSFLVNDAISENILRLPRLLLGITAQLLGIFVNL